MDFANFANSKKNYFRLKNVSNFKNYFQLLIFKIINRLEIFFWKFGRADFCYFSKNCHFCFFKTIFDTKNFYQNNSKNCCCFFGNWKIECWNCCGEYLSATFKIFWNCSSKFFSDFFWNSFCFWTKIFSTSTISAWKFQTCQNFPNFAKFKNRCAQNSARPKTTRDFIFSSRFLQFSLLFYCANPKLRFYFAGRRRSTDFRFWFGKWVGCFREWCRWSGAGRW